MHSFPDLKQVTKKNWYLFESILNNTGIVYNFALEYVCLPCLQFYFNIFSLCIVFYRNYITSELYIVWQCIVMQYENTSTGHQPIVLPGTKRRGLVTTNWSFCILCKDSSGGVTNAQKAGIKCDEKLSNEAKLQGQYSLYMYMA